MIYLISSPAIFPLLVLVPKEILNALLLASFSNMEAISKFQYHKNNQRIITSGLAFSLTHPAPTCDAFLGNQI
jgi:hypothetical protein